MEANIYSKITDIPEMRVVDVMLISQQITLSEKITINKRELVQIMGKSEKRINALLNNKIIPEHLIVGGYEGRRQRKALMFYTKEVLEWLKGD